MARMSEKDIKENISKIRREHELGEVRSKLYNVNAFNDRYMRVLKQNLDISIFISAELAALEDIESKIKMLEYEKQKRAELQARNQEESVMKKVDEIISNFESALKKYPKKELFETAEDEIEYLYGAVDELYTCFSVVRSFYENKSIDYMVETALKDFDNKFQRFILPTGTLKCPQIFTDYVFCLKTKTPASRGEQFILKESGMFVNSLIKKMEDIRHLALRVDADAKVILPEDLSKQSPRVHKFFVGKTRQEVYDSTLAYAKSLVSDFRLTSFKKADNEK